MKARPLQALIPSGKASSAVPAPVALCRPSVPPYRASWAAWPGMSLPGPRGLPSVPTSAQGGPPMFANVLTLRGLSGMVKAPNTVRRHRRLCRAPHGEKCGFFVSASYTAASASCGRRYILAEQRPVSARTGGLTVAGERCSAFFCALKTPKHSRFLMIPTITAALRPAVTALPCNLIPAGGVRHD